MDNGTIVPSQQHILMEAPGSADWTTPLAAASLCTEKHIFVFCAQQRQVQPCAGTARVAI